jgi:uncharacterized protein DUF3168
MTSVLEVHHIALHALLTGDGALAALVGTRVYDLHAPADAAYPYITLGSAGEASVDSFGGDGSAPSRTLHIWTRLEGKRASTRQCYAIWGHVRRLLEGPMTMTGHKLVTAGVRLVDVLVDPDDADHLTVHGLVRYDATTEAG